MFDIVYVTVDIQCMLSI